MPAGIAKIIAANIPLNAKNHILAISALLFEFGIHIPGNTLNSGQ